MPSPDATPYVDLRLFDKDTQDVFAAALVNLQSYLPLWEPREGHTEVLLMESLALEVSEAVFAINRVPGAIVEVLLRLYNIERDLGTPPTTSLTFTVSDTVGHRIPIGTRASLSLPNEDALIFTTTDNLDIPPGQTTGTVAAVGDRNTDVGNGTITATAVELLDAIVFVERVQLASVVTGGAEPEDDTAWFTRGITRFSRLAETLVLPRHFSAAALERPEVERAFAVDNYNPTAGSGVPGDHAGHITVAVYGAGGPLTAQQRADMQIVMDAQAQANLAVHVVDPVVTAVNVTATVVGKPGFTTTQVRTNVIAALTAYLSPQTWEWGTTVYRNELIALLDAVEGVQRVTSITVPAADLSLGGVAPLASLGTVSITVTA